MKTSDASSEDTAWPETQYTRFNPGKPYLEGNRPWDTYFANVQQIPHGPGKGLWQWSVTACFPGPELDPDNPFEATVDRLFQVAIRLDDGAARTVWNALADVEWSHEGDDLFVWCSPRGAGDLVAAIGSRGTFRDWYREGDGRLVHPAIAHAMAAKGWTWRLRPVE
jgi:hypothetical protein